jgi:fumarate hydratase class I
MDLKAPVLELIRKASSDLPPDVEQSIKRAQAGEEKNTPAWNVFNTILENVRMARKQSTPICQDTGSLVFYIDYPEGGLEKEYKKAVSNAVVEATSLQYLRPNAVDPVTAKNSGNNLGVNAPYIHFNQWDKKDIRIRLMLKGGGSENVGTQYKLPHSPLGAGRDLKGVRKVVIDAVRNAQGLGCAPGAIGVGIGGTRDISFTLSKEQFFRRIGQRSESEELARLETKLYEDLNKLGIGPMGFGGKTTVLEVFIGSQHRHPATFYVSISYMCWAFRRKTLHIINGEVSYDD